MNTLYALTILRILNLGFNSESGLNPVMKSFTNSKESIYIGCNDDGSVTIVVYKNSSRKYLRSIIDDSQIESVATELKELIKCKDQL